jgi:glycosyltransferase involved in cell wall biosynthesis
MDLYLITALYLPRFILDSSPKTTMRIGVVVDVPIYAGAQIAAINECLQLEKFGHQATLIVITSKNQSSEFINQTQGLTVQFLLPFYLKILPFNYLSLSHLVSPLVGMVKLRNYDWFIVHNSINALPISLIPNKKFTLIIHDPLNYILKQVYPFFSFLRRLLFLYEFSTIKSSSKVVLDSPFHQQFIKSEYGLTPHVSPLGTSIPSRPPQKLGNYIIASSRWQKEKNPQLLLDLLLKYPQLKMIIAGTWSKDLAWFTALSKKYQLTKRLTLLPNFLDAKRTWLFKQGRVWIHPHTEAFGLDAIAAAAHGLPVIMPPASGAFRLLNSKLSFSDIPKLYSKPSLATTIGQKNYRLAKARFTWENHTRQLLP